MFATKAIQERKISSKSADTKEMFTFEQAKVIALAEAGNMTELAPFLKHQAYLFWSEKLTSLAIKHLAKAGHFDLLDKCISQSAFGETDLYANAASGAALSGYHDQVFKYIKAAKSNVVRYVILSSAEIGDEKLTLNLISLEPLPQRKISMIHTAIQYAAEAGQLHLVDQLLLLGNNIIDQYIKSPAEQKVETQGEELPLFPGVLTLELPVATYKDQLLTAAIRSLPIHKYLDDSLVTKQKYIGEQFLPNYQHIKKIMKEEDLSITQFVFWGLWNGSKVRELVITMLSMNMVSDISIIMAEYFAFPKVSFSEKEFNVNSHFHIKKEALLIDLTRYTSTMGFFSNQKNVLAFKKMCGDAKSEPKLKSILQNEKLVAKFTKDDEYYGLIDKYIKRK